MPQSSIPSSSESVSGARVTERGLPWIVIVAAGVIAAMHIWKLPGALDGIRTDFGMSLVAAGTLLGVVQVGSMVLGLVASLFSELIGLRRTLLIGLLLLTIGSLAGAFSPSAAFLMLTRAFEGIGFLMTTVVAPALIRRHTTASSANVALGWWGAFQGLGAFIAILVSTSLLTAVSWQVWWGIMAAFTALIIPVVITFVPADPARSQDHESQSILRPALVRIGRTVRALPPWGIAIVFACYSLQWGALIGFLPTIFAENGVDALLAGIATAIVAGVNGVGNVLTGILLQRGAQMRALVIGALMIMGVTSWLFFAIDWADVPGGLLWQVAAVGCLSFFGAAVPTCLMRLAVDVAPRDGSPAAVLGLMQQIYNGANFLGPIVLAALAATVGGWHLSWVVTVGASTLGIVLAVFLLRRGVLASLR